MDDQENIVTRLRTRIRDAKRQGFRVRTEILDEEQASWCVIGDVKTIFIDLSQTAAEQLSQLNETLATFASEQQSAAQSAAQSPQQAA